MTGFEAKSTAVEALNEATTKNVVRSSKSLLMYPFIPFAASPSRRYQSSIIYLFSRNAVYACAIEFAGHFLVSLSIVEVTNAICRETPPINRIASLGADQYSRKEVENLEPNSTPQKTANFYAIPQTSSGG